MLWGCKTMVVVAISMSTCVADLSNVEDSVAHPRVTVGRYETIRLESQPPLSPNEAGKIKALIKNLANIDSPDFGLSPTFSGFAFAPIPSARETGAMILTNPGVKESNDFKELVKLGPKALPFLLKALDEKTPTKLVRKSVV